MELPFFFAGGTHLMLIKSDPQAVLRLLRNSTAKERAAKAA
jgi:hypothetical protein